MIASKTFFVPVHPFQKLDILNLSGFWVSTSLMEKSVVAGWKETDWPLSKMMEDKDNYNCLVCGNNVSCYIPIFIRFLTFSSHYKMKVMPLLLWSDGTRCAHYAAVVC